MQTIGPGLPCCHWLQALGAQIRRLLPLLAQHGSLKTDALERFPLPAFADGPTTLSWNSKSPWWSLRSRIEQIRQLAKVSEVDVRSATPQLENPLATRRREEIFSALKPLLRRFQVGPPSHSAPSTLDYIQVISEGMAGIAMANRVALMDQALVGRASAESATQPVVAAGHQKGRNTKENVARNFRAMASPRASICKGHASDGPHAE